MKLTLSDFATSYIWTCTSYQPEPVPTLAQCQQLF